VEDEQRELCAPPLQEGKRRMVGGDRERTDFLFIAVVSAHALDPERIGKLREPLGDERTCWSNDARACPQRVDRQQRDECLASPCREDDCASRARGPP